MPNDLRWWQALPGHRALREVTILVVGILIAFALDAWWEQRATVASERAHLHALRLDFRRNVRELEDLVQLQERISRSSRDLLLLAQRSEAAPPDSVQRLLGMVFTSDRFQPVMGAYRALESSAGLAQLRDDSLRAELAAFAAQLDVRYYERFSEEVYLSMIREFMGEFRFFAPYVADRERAGTLQPLLANSKFQEYLALRHLTERDVASEYRELARQARSILARLQRLTR